MRARCVEHTQIGNRGGYGTGKQNGKTEYLHRLAYCASVGVPIDTIHGKVVMHACDNPRCINPEHLSLGTHQDNTNDMRAKGRQSYPSGAASATAILTEEQVIMIRANYKARCRTHGAYALGRLLGVSNTTVRDVVKGRTWA